MPEMNSMNHGATPNESAVEVGSTRPIVSLRELASRRAELSGNQPRASAAARMRSRVDADTPGRPLRAYEAALIETPARSATSLIVGRPSARGVVTTAA